jgi:ribosomal protein L37AE/L43A
MGEVGSYTRHDLFNSNQNKHLSFLFFEFLIIISKKGGICMARIMSTNVFEGEDYFCYECDKDLTKKEIENWHCSHCGERVRINAGLDQYIMRKLPEEVTENDYFVMRSREFHQIFKVECKNDTYYYNLKGYGRYKQDSEEWVNCMYLYES